MTKLFNGDETSIAPINKHLKYIVSFKPTMRGYVHILLKERLYPNKESILYSNFMTIINRPPAKWSELFNSLVIAYYDSLPVGILLVKSNRIIEDSDYYVYPSYRTFGIEESLIKIGHK